MSVLSPFFRYSWSRQGYVLKLIGKRIGPVLQVEDDAQAAPTGTPGAEGATAPPQRSGRFDRPAVREEEQDPHSQESER